MDTFEIAAWVSIREALKAIQADLNTGRKYQSECINDPLGLNESTLIKMASATRAVEMHLYGQSDYGLHIYTHPSNLIDFMLNSRKA